MISTIKWYAFNDNKFTKLTFTWNSNLTKIQSHSFETNNLEWELKIPDSVITIESYSFNNAFNKEAENTLILWNNIQTIWDNAFFKNNFTWTLVLPDTLTWDIWNSSFRENSFNWLQSNGTHLMIINLLN